MDSEPVIQTNDAAPTGVGRPRRWTPRQSRRGGSRVVPQAFCSEKPVCPYRSVGSPPTCANRGVHAACRGHGWRRCRMIRRAAEATRAGTATRS